MAEEERNFPLWTGFQYRWRRYPHRLSQLSAFIDNSRVPQFAARVGNFPREGGNRTIYYSQLAGGQWASCLLSLQLNLRGNHGEWMQAETVYTPNFIELEPWIDPARLRTECLIQGFELSPKNNPAGWHFGALGLNISSPVKSAHSFPQFTITAHARPTYAPEPFTHGNRQWHDKPSCEYTMRVWLLWIGSHHLESQVKWLSETADVRGDFEKKYALNQVPGSFTALKGFSVRLADAHQPGRGRYLRGLGAWVDAQRNEAGIAFSNKGPITFGCEVSTDLFLANLKMNDERFTATPGKSSAAFSSAPFR